MKFTPTKVAGAFAIAPEPIADDRGFFSRLWCERELADQGLITKIRQTNVGFSVRQGTLRGLHYQKTPHREVKLLRCTRGWVFDVVVDLRPESSTYLQWAGVELSADNHVALYVPEGCATGYLTLTDDAEVYYHTSEFFAPDSATGVRWDDPTFAIDWPAKPVVVSPQDQQWPNFSMDS